MFVRLGYTVPASFRVGMIDTKAYGASVITCGRRFLDLASGNHFRGNTPIQQALDVLTGRRPEIPESPLE